MLFPTLKAFKDLSLVYKRIPFAKEILADMVTPIALLKKIAARSAQFFLLESVEGGERWGRYSFMGFDPVLRAYCDDGLVNVERYEKRNEDQVFTYKKQALLNKKQYRSDKPWEILREILSDYESPQIEVLPVFSGGLVGYSAYAMYAYVEPSLKIKRGASHDFDWMLFERVIAYDHLKQKIILISNQPADGTEESFEAGKSSLEEMAHFVMNQLEENLELEMKEDKSFQARSSLDFNAYEKMLAKAREYIFAGDIFQVVLSRRFEATHSGDLINAYRMLRTSNPSPYMVYLKTDDEEIISTSPETLVRLNNGKLSTFPVAGSRPRGLTAEEDLALEQDLLEDEKELAEHNMLVDLGRNDLGRIAKTSTVHVSTYKAIHRYSRIMHICSQVDAEIREGLDAFDALNAVLPAGTLSGAPKIRACQIIDELEQEARGVYGGALGYISLSGQLDSCIAIRMAVKKEGKIVVQAGGGIVADSVPKTEFEETAHKAAAVLAAIAAAKEM